MNLSLPEQKVSQNTKKTKKWIEGCLNAIVSRSFGGTNGARSSSGHKKINYDLVNGEIDLSDVTYVTQPYGSSVDEHIGKLPAKFQNYNKIKQAISTLTGEEILRPFYWKVVTTGGEGKNIWNEQYAKSLSDSYLNILESNINGTDPTEDPAEVDKYFKNSYQGNIEITANKLLKFLVKDLRLERLFNLGYKDYLISAEQVYYAGIYNNEPKLKKLNPIHFDCDLSNDDSYIEDCDWGVYREYLDRGTVLDEYGELLTNAEKKLLDNPDIYNSLGPYQYVPEVINTLLDDFHGSNKILVRTVAWKGYKKVGLINYIDEKGIQVKDILTEDQIDEYETLGHTVDVQWVPETMIGIQIGSQIYKAFPCPYQANTVDNIYASKIPFIGGISNSLNSKPTSLVDLLKPYQYLYNIIWYRLELEFAKASGKKIIFDIAQVPKSKGWSFEEWMYYFNTTGIAFINSVEMNEKGQTPTFNQFQGIDMTISNNISGYFDMLRKIEENMDVLSGITPQRRGTTTASETATGVNTAIQQSYALTEIYFYEHNLVKERVLTYLLELAKVAYKDNEKGKLVFDEFTRELLKINQLKNSDFGIYVTNSTKDNKTLEALKMLAEKALSAAAIDFSTVATLYQSDSITEVKNEIKASEQNKQKMAAQQNQVAQAQIESNERLAREAMENENNQNQLDRDNELRKEEIRALGTIGINNPDVNGNGLPDVTEIAKLSIMQSKEEFNQIERSERLKIDKSEMQTKLQLQKNENEQQNKQHADKMMLEGEKLKIAKEKLSIDRKALKYKKTPNTPKKK